MASLHTRHRRMLSLDRRTGLQVPPEVARGVSQRHAQGWADQMDDDRDSLLTVDTIMRACLWGGIVWMIVAAMLATALYLLG